MKVFVTGASGFIGQAVVPELLNHGHSVIGLARSDDSAAILSKQGVKVIRGDLHTLDSLREGARDSDGVIHLAFISDFSSPEAFAKATATDRAAITAMAEAMAGTKKPLLICSGTLGLTRGQISTEDTEPFVPPGFDRDLSTALIVSLSKEKDVRGMVMRLAPTVHGKDGNDYKAGLLNPLVGLGHKAGFLAYVDENTRWTAVHRNDAASCFRLAFEKGRAGVTYLPISEGAVKLKDTMTVVSKLTGLPVEKKTPEELAASHGFFGHLLSADTPVNSEKTRKELGWEPKELGFLEDIEKNSNLSSSNKGIWEGVSQIKN